MSLGDQTQWDWNIACTLVTIVGIVVTLISVFAGFHYGKKKGRLESIIGPHIKISTGDNSKVTINAPDLKTETKGD